MSQVIRPTVTLLVGWPSLLLTSLSASATLQLNSCKLSSTIVCSNLSRLLVLSRLIPLLAMLWQNTLVSWCCYYPILTDTSWYQAANLYDIDLTFIRDHAEAILTSSSITYLRAAQLKGSIFQADCDDGAVSSVFTSFYVDHAEPLEALEQYKAKGQWGLGELLDGHEFLAIFPVIPMSPTANAL